jgi:adenylate cyclase class 2
MSEQELEVKFYLNDLGALEQKLKSIGANLVQPRIFETNLRFDTRDGELNQGGRVLRLRQDAQAVLTYKGPSQLRQDVNIRQEIEFTVSDFTAARHFLEALGFQVAVTYEKFRTTYDLDGVEIVLDEMPFGNFMEIEGPDPISIQDIASKLGLNWEVRCIESYMGLFQRVRQTRRLAFRDLTFINFNQVKILPEELAVKAAD